MLQDSHRRRFGYLRLSLTKACALRCVYCRPAQMGHPRGEPLLTPEEIERLIRHLARQHGVHKVRLTGGDPTSRPDLVEIIGRIAALPGAGAGAGVPRLAMTTHGLTLAQHAGAYARAGLHAVNISLDTLDRARFAHLTGVDGLERVLAGIDAALAAGLAPIRLNAVVVKGQNERDLVGLVRFAGRKGVEVRFIELMPMGPLAPVWAQRYVPEARMREHLDAAVTAWAELPQGADSARRYRVRLDDGQEATVGFITPMSCNFCASCNRMRLAADGTLYPCLMDQPAGTLLPALRPRFDPDELDRRLEAAFAHKAMEHPHQGVVVMTHIGG
jgi:GTP 3',8-cyclase